MGFFRRLTRKLKRDEKYINIASSMFWPTVILSMGCWMLWMANTRYSGFRKDPRQVSKEVMYDTDTFNAPEEGNFMTIKEDSTQVPDTLN